MKKYFIILGIFLLAASLGGFVIGETIKNSKVDKSPLVFVPSDTRIPTPLFPGNPLTLRIPSLAISTEIEMKGVDDQGRMDVPSDPDNVSWYSPGVKPGELGNAVLAGHLNTPQDLPAVFWNLTELEKGDEIFVDYESGESAAFIVKDIVDYQVEEMPLDDIFAKDNDSNLHLITCSGSWNRNDQSYSNRVVVYADKKSAQ